MHLLIEIKVHYVSVNLVNGVGGSQEGLLKYCLIEIALFITILNSH